MIIIRPKNFRDPDESRYLFERFVGPVIKLRGFGAFFIKSSLGGYKKLKRLYSDG